LTQTAPSGKIMPAWGVVPFAPGAAVYTANPNNLKEGLDQDEGTVS
jgi:hypothetical protein